MKLVRTVYFIVVMIVVVIAIRLLNERRQQLQVPEFVFDLQTEQVIVHSIHCHCKTNGFWNVIPSNGCLLTNHNVVESNHLIWK